MKSLHWPWSLSIFQVLRAEVRLLNSMKAMGMKNLETVGVEMNSDVEAVSEKPIQKG